MKKPLAQRFAIGATLTVDMNKPKEGKFPIGRTSEGIICFLKKGVKGFFEYGSTWAAEIVEIKDKVMIIEPIECVNSRGANEYELQKRLSEMKGKRIIL